MQADEESDHEYVNAESPRIQNMTIEEQQIDQVFLFSLASK